jgi:hypothetical protein
MLSKSGNSTLRGRMKEKFSKHGKKLFWAWIIYHTIKGILTTSLIWIPLIYLWLGSDG